MASSTKLCTKADLMERIKEYDEKDYIGLLVSTQNGREKPVHEAFIFYDAKDIFLQK